MKIANKRDLEKVIDIICQSFHDNPHISQIIKNDSKRDIRLRVLAKYVFYFGMKMNGVYLTDDDQGVLILYKNQVQRRSLMDVFRKIELSIRAITLTRIIFVKKLESMVNQKRQNNEDHLYLWFFGVTKATIGTGNAREMMRFSFSKSYDEKLPIYCETSIFKNMSVYKRYGFSEYNFLEPGINELKIWYLRRDWK